MVASSPGHFGSAGAHHQELIAVELRAGMPHVDLTLDLVCQFLRVGLAAVAAAEVRQVLLKGTVVIVPPGRGR